MVSRQDSLCRVKLCEHFLPSAKDPLMDFEIIAVAASRYFRVQTTPWEASSRGGIFGLQGTIGNKKRPITGR